MAEGIQCCFERYERKYRLTKAQQRLILNGMRNHMKADNYGRYTICNIYYDTDDWRLVRASIEKPVYKEKLRVRSYGVQDDDGKVFVELKKKYDGVVYKRRITTAPETAKDFLDGEIPGSSFGQIGREIEWFQSFYSAVRERALSSVRRIPAFRRKISRPTSFLTDSTAPTNRAASRAQASASGFQSPAASPRDMVAA